MPKNFSRKAFLSSIAGGLASVSLLKNLPVQAMTKNTKMNAPAEGQFSQTPLAFHFDALEPHIDKETMTIHYSKHANGYMTKLNTLWAEEVKGEKNVASLETLFAKISDYSTNLRNNAGGHYNHEFFWKTLTPKSVLTENLSVVQNIQKTFGSMDNFKQQFSDKAKSVFGSGWCWLIKDAQGNLKMTSTPNQDNPLMNVVPERGTPILGLDVWEHAYYLKYQNKRADYIASFWNVVNWNEVNNIFSKSI